MSTLFSNWEPDKNKLFFNFFFSSLGPNPVPQYSVQYYFEFCFLFFVFFFGLFVYRVTSCNLGENLVGLVTPASIPQTFLIRWRGSPDQNAHIERSSSATTSVIGAVDVKSFRAAGTAEQEREEKKRRAKWMLSSAEELPSLEGLPW